MKPATARVCYSVALMTMLVDECEEIKSNLESKQTIRKELNNKIAEQDMGSANNTFGVLAVSVGNFVTGMINEKARMIEIDQIRLIDHFLAMHRLEYSDSVRSFARELLGIDVMCGQDGDAYTSIIADFIHEQKLTQEEEVDAIHLLSRMFITVVTEDVTPRPKELQFCREFLNRLALAAATETL